MRRHVRLRPALIEKDERARLSQRAHRPKGGGHRVVPLRRNQALVSRPPHALLCAVHRAFADAYPGACFPPRAVNREGGVGIGRELGDERGLIDRREGARATGTGLRRERTGDAPLLDVPFGAVEADIVAITDDGLRRAVIDRLDDALAEILGTCFHDLTIASSQ